MGSRKARHTRIHKDTQGTHDGGASMDQRMHHTWHEWMYECINNMNVCIDSFVDTGGGHERAPARSNKRLTQITQLSQLSQWIFWGTPYIPTVPSYATHCILYLISTASYPVPINSFFQPSKFRRHRRQCNSNSTNTASQLLNTQWMLAGAMLHQTLVVFFCSPSTMGVINTRTVRGRCY